MTTPATTADPVQPVVQIADVAPAAPAPVPAPAPAVVDATAPAAPAAAATPSPEMEALRWQLGEYKTREARQQNIQREQQKAAGLQTQAQRVYDEEIAKGLEPADAQRIAQRHFEALRQVDVEREQLREQQDFFDRRQRASVTIGKEFGVDPRLLLNTTDTPQMREIAALHQQIARNDARLKALEQGRVPAQKFDGSGGGTGNGVIASDDNVDKHWMDFENESRRLGQPNRPNPYEAQLRNLIRR